MKLYYLQIILYNNFVHCSRNYAQIGSSYLSLQPLPNLLGYLEMHYNLLWYMIFLHLTILGLDSLIRSGLILYLRLHLRRHSQPGSVLYNIIAYLLQYGVVGITFQTFGGPYKIKRLVLQRRVIGPLYHYLKKRISSDGLGLDFDFNISHFV